MLFQGIGVGMLLAFFVDDLKIEEVEIDTPPYTTTSGIGFRINCLQVEQRAVVRHDIEGRMTQVVGVCPDGGEDPKEFSIIGGVIFLGVGQFFGAVAMTRSLPSSICVRT